MTDAVAKLCVELAGNTDTSDLAQSLEQIRMKLDQHWKIKYLYWFTDHGVGHANRVANQALALAVAPHLLPSIRLSPLERYVLCAAALLHDIGMNDLSLCDRPLGQMLPNDYETVRYQHADRSYNMIIGDPQAWGLPIQDPTLAEVVGLVARAHGTQYYRSTLAYLEQRRHVRNHAVRSPLLAAILLMADEMDLYYGREQYEPGQAALNAVSEAHAFKHRCVSSASCEIATDGTISIKIRLSMPDSLSDDYKADIQRWIVSKLRRQMALVDSEIAEGFNKQISFDRAIRVDHVGALAARPQPSLEALAIIRAELASEDLIDHREALQQSITSLHECPVMITGEWNAEMRQDVSGREDLYRTVIEKFLTDSSAVVARSRRLYELGSGEASDILEEWVQDLAAVYDIQAMDNEPEESRRNSLLDICTSAIRAIGDDKLIIFAVSCIDRLSEHAIKWIINTAMQRIREERPSRSTFLLSAESRNILVPGKVITVSAEALNSDEVCRHLKGLGFKDAETLVGVDLLYHNLKRICDKQWVLLHRG